MSITVRDDPPTLTCDIHGDHRLGIYFHKDLSDWVALCYSCDEDGTLFSELTEQVCAVH